MQHEAIYVGLAHLSTEREKKLLWLQKKDAAVGGSYDIRGRICKQAGKEALSVRHLEIALEGGTRP